MKKARHGDGSVYQRPQDGLWVGTVRLLDADGQRKRKTVYGKTKTEATKKLRAITRMVEDGVPVVESRATVASVVTPWAATTLPMGNRRASTVETYRTLIRTLVLPGVGTVPLADLTPQRVEEWAATMTAAGKSPATVRKAMDVLGMALDVAVRDKRLRTNPVREAARPRLARPDVSHYSSKEVAALLDNATGRLSPALTLAVFTGLRRGEMLGLRWRDVDLAGGHFAVTGTLGRVGGKLTRTEPKTNAGVRVVPLVEEARQALLDAKTTQDADRAASPHWHDSGYVFTTASGEPVDPDNLARWFTKVRTDAGVTHGSWHTLRHSAASTLLRSGVPMIVVSRLLGHAKIQITLDLYGHLTTSDIAEAVAVGFTGYGKTPTDNVVPIRDRAV
jgi:integrase